MSIKAHFFKNTSPSYRATLNALHGIAIGASSEALTLVIYKAPRFLSESTGTRLPEALAHSYWGASKIYAGTCGIGKYLQGKDELSSHLWTLGVGSLHLVRAIHYSALENINEGPLLCFSIAAVGMVNATITGESTVKHLVQNISPPPGGERDWKCLGASIVGIYGVSDAYKRASSRINPKLTSN